MREREGRMGASTVGGKGEGTQLVRPLTSD